MKATYVPKESWPEMQRGRELTVYVYRHSDHDVFADGGPMARALFDSHKAESGSKGVDDEDLASWWLDDCFEQTNEFWEPFIRETEHRLLQHGIGTRGCADGDLALGGEYASIRNEAFIRDHNTSDNYHMPTNEQGFNSANHSIPSGLIPKWIIKAMLKAVRPWLRVKHFRCPVLSMLRWPLR
jgi:hypothetical protein